MRKPVIIAWVIVGAVAGLALINYLRTPRLSVAQLRQAEEVTQQLKQDSQSEDTVEPCPDVFKVKFESSAGTFVAEFYKEWAPLGAQRVYELVKANFFDQARFFRVVKGFVAQFGMAADPAIQAMWDKKPIGVDMVKQSNVRGTITFAMRGSAPFPDRTNETRSTQLFINLVDNVRLDAMGFAPVGKVTEGMDVVDRLNSEYGEEPDQNQIKERGGVYLAIEFPRLDYIKSASILE